MGLLYDGYRMPPRETLGDLDVAEWPAGLSGEPEDPWLHQQNLVLQQVDTRELFTFSDNEQNRPPRRRKFVAAFRPNAAHRARRCAGHPAQGRRVSAQGRSHRLGADAAVCRRGPRTT